MDPGFVSIVGFGAVVIIGGLIMAAVSFFSMKETNYESIMEKKRQEIGISDKERVKVNKQKRDLNKKKFETKKKKSGPAENKKGSLSDSAPAEKQRKAPPTPPSVEQNNKPPVESETADNLKKKESAKNAKAIKQKKQVNPSEVLTMSKPEVVQQTNIVKTSPKSDSKKDKKDVKNQAETNKKAAVPSKKVVSVDVTKSAVDKKVKEQAAKKNAASGEPAKKIKVAKKAVSEGGNLLGASRPKKKSTSEPDLVEMIRSATIDDATVSMLVDLLNEKSRQSDWTPAETGSRKSQVAELQRQLAQKEVEYVKRVEEYRRNQLKLKQQTQELVSLKQKDSKMVTMLEKSKHENTFLKQEMEKKLENQQKEMMLLQTQMKLSSDKSALNKLKDENDILLQTIKANAANLSEKQMELQHVQAKLEDSLRNREEGDLKLAKYQLNAQRQSESESVYSKHVEDLKMKLMNVEAQYGKLENEYQKTQKDLQYSQSKSADLLDQIVSLSNASDQRSTIESQLADTKQALEQRLVELDTNDAKQAEETAKLHTQNKDLMKKVEQLKMENQSMVELLAQHKASANKVTEDLQMSANKINEKDAAIVSLQSDVDTAKDEQKQLEVEIEKLKKKNNELRERNWKAMDAVAAAEKSFKENLTVQKVEADSSMSALQQRVRDELQRAFPSVAVSHKDFHCWLSEFLAQTHQPSSGANAEALQEKEKEIDGMNQRNSRLVEEAKKHEASFAALNCSLSSAMEQKKALESEVSMLKESSQNNASEAEKYKKILTSTEDILSSLQSTVESEEQEKSNKSVNDAKKLTGLMEKLETKSNLLEELTLENDKLKSDISKMQETSEPDTKKDASVEDQGFLIVDQVEQNGMGSGQNDEVTKLKERLDKEKALTKNLGAAANKLQTLLIQTQDELSKERIKNRSAETQEDDKELD